jgi:CRP-like cAMP-binding protein
MTVPRTSSAQHRAVLASNPAFGGLPAPVQDALFAAGRLRSAVPQERIYARGDPSNGMYAVIEGRVRLSYVSAAGRSFVVNLFGPGALIGEMATLDGGPRDADADAEVASLLLHWTPEAIEALIVAHPTFARMLLRLGAARLRRVLDWVARAASQPLESRVATRLLLLTGGPGPFLPLGGAERLDLSQEALARLVGVTRQRINQVLRDWQARGLVRLETGRIVLRDPAALRALSETG